MKNCYIVDLNRGLTCICCLQSTWTFLWHQIHWKSLSPGPSPAGSSHTSQIESRGRFPSTHLNRKEIYITAHITDVCKRWGGGSFRNCKIVLSDEPSFFCLTIIKSVKHYLCFRSPSIFEVASSTVLARDTDLHGVLRSTVRIHLVVVHAAAPQTVQH